jgi:hypothetical protein
VTDIPSALISPEATASYPALFTPKLPKNAKPTDKPKFSVTLLFTPAAMQTPEFKAMQEAVVRCAVNKWGAKGETMIREKALRLPFRTDVESKGHPADYACFINCNTGEATPPAVVGRDGKPITDQREVYAGCKVRVSLGAYAYGGPGTDQTPGVALGLRNVQKLGDGPRLDNRTTAAQDFGAPLPPLPGTEGADLTSLLG